MSPGDDRNLHSGKTLLKTLTRAGVALAALMTALAPSLTATAASAVTARPLVQPDARLARSLMRLDPSQRFQELCDVAALKTISQHEKGMRPDRAQLDAISAPRRRGDALSGDGAAVRSRGQWRRFSFSCVADPEKLTVSRFTYELGEVIPESQWERYNLWR
ncbi:DUF930 domain-containing protein [Camelimonas abortus]|uniref:DUF930 domain-containing protein n=1 Tax=Camelimonas abortus TaxID=1017184 RepID=UPI0035E66992